MTKKLQKNTAECACCGQVRPYPTVPGKWKFKRYYSNTWTTVTVAADDEGLTITPEGESEPIWWPENAQWEEIQE